MEHRHLLLRGARAGGVRTLIIPQEAVPPSAERWMEGIVLQKGLCREGCVRPAPLLLVLHHDGRLVQLEEDLPTRALRAAG
eukprot:15471324-Heterocapsa_arctica.AAC.1